MANAPTTPSFVASRLTDEEVLKLAKDCDGLVSTDYATGEPDYFGNLEVKKAAVLRDYVRMRKLNGKLRECLNQAYGDKMNTYRMTGNEVQNWEIVLAEAEKGEAR